MYLPEIFQKSIFGCLLPLLLTFSDFPPLKIDIKCLRWFAHNLSPALLSCLFSQCSELGPNGNIFQFLDFPIFLPLGFEPAIPSLESSPTSTPQTPTHPLASTLMPVGFRKDGTWAGWGPRGDASRLHPWHLGRLPCLEKRSL